MKSVHLLLLSVALALLAPFAASSSVQHPGQWVTQGPQNQAAIIPQRLESTWVSGGITHTVITDRHDNEAIDTWAKRHKEAVNGVVQYFPPDHPQHAFGWEVNWLYGDTLFSQWEWHNQQYGGILTTLSTERDIANGETIPQWAMRHKMALKGCLLALPM